MAGVSGGLALRLPAEDVAAALEILARSGVAYEGLHSEPEDGAGPG